jgi:hypothetical protein
MSFIALVAVVANVHTTASQNDGGKAWTRVLLR